MSEYASSITSSYTPKRLAVKLNAKGEQFVMQGHPWVFSDNITNCSPLAFNFTANRLGV